MAEKEDVDLVSVGYKYNKKAVLTFVFTKGAGKTTKGEPYSARFPDKFGNVCTRQVARPDIVSHYFRYSNVVDLHNQARQFDLALEKKWVTQNGYFRLYTTILGMNVVDCWKLKKRRYDDTTISQFADQLAADLLIQAEEIDENVSPTIPQTVSTESSIEVSTEVSSIGGNQGTCPVVHTKEILKGGKQLRCIWCSRVNLIERKTTLRCKECGKGFCRDESGNGCWSNHLCYGGVPNAPKRGTKKRKVCEEDDEDLDEDV